MPSLVVLVGSLAVAFADAAPWVHVVAGVVFVAELIDFLQSLRREWKDEEWKTQRDTLGALEASSSEELTRPLIDRLTDFGGNE